MPVRLPSGPCDLSGFDVSLEPPEQRGEVSQITDHILVTDVWNALDPQVWQKHKITHILSMMRLEDIPPKAQAQLQAFTSDGGSLVSPRRVSISIDDSREANLISVLPRAQSFIDNALNERSDAMVLIHCFAGTSRSASCAIAYLIDALDISMLMAFKKVRDARPSIRPNSNFLGQLREWDRGRVERSNGRLLAQALPFYG